MVRESRPSGDTRARRRRWSAEEQGPQEGDGEGVLPGLGTAEERVRERF